MSEESVPKKKAARKTARKRPASKKAAKKSVPEDKAPPASEEQLPLTEETPKVLPGESLSSNTENHEPAIENNPPEEESEKAKPKSRVRDARRETASEPIEETREPLIKETNDDAPRKKEKDRDRDRDNGDRENQRGDRPEKGGRRRGRGKGRREDGPVQPRPEVDFDQMRKKAWKIYHSEVTEEGLALLDDKALREYARSSFNAARLFLEEEQKLK